MPSSRTAAAGATISLPTTPRPKYSRWFGGRSIRQPDEDKVLPWLYGIAYRVIGHQWRGRARYRKLQQRLLQAPSSVQPGPESSVLGKLGNRPFIEALGRLRHADQEILRLAAWEGLPHAKIAQALSISVSAAEQRFHRAKKRLAAEMDKTDSHDSIVSKGGLS